MHWRNRRLLLKDTVLQSQSKGRDMTLNELRTLYRENMLVEAIIEPRSKKAHGL